MKKAITWFALWKRLGKQPLSRTLNKKVTIRINDIDYECALVFEENGSKFHLEMINYPPELDGKTNKRR